MFGLKLQAPDMAYYLIHYFLVILFLLLASFIYFRKAKAGVLQGLYLGLIFIIIGVVLDSIITIPFFMKMDYSFLISGELLIGYAIGLVVCMVVGGFKK